MSDPIRNYLRKKGCSEHVVKTGLAGLIETWETIVTEISHGYDLTMEDYLNDMDTRQLIQEVAPLATTPAQKSLVKKLNRIDAIMRTLIEPTMTSLWGDAVAAEHGWLPEHHWWYFHRPKNAGPELREELEKQFPNGTLD